MHPVPLFHFPGDQTQAVPQVLPHPAPSWFPQQSSGLYSPWGQETTV